MEQYLNYVMLAHSIAFGWACLAAIIFSFTKINPLNEKIPIIIVGPFMVTTIILFAMQLFI